MLALVAAGLYLTKLLPANFLPKSLGPLGERLGERLDETRLTGSVKAALHLNRLTRDGRIAVSSEEGVVTIRGEVASEEARDTAARVAAAVPEVRQVVSHLKVAASPPPAPGRSLGESLDDRTQEVEVRLALSLRRELKGSAIEVRVFRRQVTLSGRVATEVLRRLALETARQTAGVAGVVDDLAIGATQGQGPVS